MRNSPKSIDSQPLIRNLGPGASRLGGQGLEVDIIAKMFETFDETLGLCGLGAADEMLSAEVLVEGAVFEHVVGGREYGCGDGADGLLRSAAAAQTQELSLQIAVFLAVCGPRALDQHGL